MTQRKINRKSQSRELMNFHVNNIFIWMEIFLQKTMKNLSKHTKSLKQMKK